MTTPKPKRNMDGIKRSTTKRTPTTRSTSSFAPRPKKIVKKPLAKPQSKPQLKPIVEVEMPEIAEVPVAESESMFDELDTVVARPKSRSVKM